MAYENIDLRDEGDERIIVFSAMERKVDRVTLDRDTGNFMFEYWVDRDEPDHEKFVIVINGIVVELYFITHYEKETDTKVYTLDAYFPNGNVDKETVFEEVRKAVEARGYHGFPKEIYYNNICVDRHADKRNGNGRLELGRFE